MLGKYSMGIGDRFGRQGKDQLRAFKMAEALGVDITPVWNKSNREHTIIGTKPADVRAESDAATTELGWTKSYFVDADHIGLANVDLFIESSDFFTLDVAESIGKPADAREIDKFLALNADLAGQIHISGMSVPITITADDMKAAASKFLLAVKEAGLIYRKIKEKKTNQYFVVEVSMDEAETPQTPAELLVILAAIAGENIPADTIAPKFTGRFNKGVDYVGDVKVFAREFEDDVLVIRHAVKKYGLKQNLKLSVHSGSDKFSIYPEIHRIIGKYGAGLHLKTAGTTWLEELAGLSCAGDAGLRMAKEIYFGALARFDEMCKPYASVIDIRQDRLPSVEQVNSWDGSSFAAALRHDQKCPDFNPDFRQLIHVGYKVAAEMGPEFLNVLERNESVVGPVVTDNLYSRHIISLFGK